MVDQDAIKLAMREVMREEMEAFYIERKEHYEHHQFVKGLKDGVEGCKSVIGKVALSSIVIGVITVLVLGVVSWIKKQIAGG
jgi:hypothetical protein